MTLSENAKSREAIGVPQSRLGHSSNIMQCDIACVNTPLGKKKLWRYFKMMDLFISFVSSMASVVNWIEKVTNDNTSKNVRHVTTGPNVIRIYVFVIY
jgi:hypothetical protein